ncbi:MAG: hypothetical protein PHW72_03165, partial [Candidatus Pacebacteria bacterium]|nr:hypothetical protein [Candidatus Paceibacterota bacterium]
MIWRRNSGKIFFLAAMLFSFLPFFVQSADLKFFIDSSYDRTGRSEVKVFLHQVANHSNFYVEEDYYQNLDIEEKQKFSKNLNTLSKEFDENIYPTLTRFLGSEWKPGIDNENKITILLTQLKSDMGGYFNEGDEYPRAQFAFSNEREMIYLNVDSVSSGLAKIYLSHEFVHLITFNWKNQKYGISEEVWLNELRAELSSTVLGYDSVYDGSNLQKRVRNFSQKIDDSLTEWRNESSDYGIINIFGQYLLDYYGINVLKDSLQSDKIGIESLNYALKKNNFSKTFIEIFTDWVVALVVNDCGVSPRYCYLNQNLKNLRVAPRINYLPSSGESILTVTDYAKDWAGNWIKFIGGRGTLKIEFIGEENSVFKIPYLLRDSSGNYSFDFLTLDSFKRGTIFVTDFDKKYEFLILMPFSFKKTSDFKGIEDYHKFMWSASMVNENSEKQKEEEAKEIARLLALVDDLKLKLASVQAKISTILAQKNSQDYACQKLDNNLYLGIKNSNEVKCLQNFLKSQGADVYPEGLVTGNYLSATKGAVIRFQEKYASEVLTPLGLSSGTGYVGL